MFASSLCLFTVYRKFVRCAQNHLSPAGLVQNNHIFLCIVCKLLKYSFMKLFVVEGSQKPIALFIQIHYHQNYPRHADIKEVIVSVTYFLNQHFLAFFSEIQNAYFEIVLSSESRNKQMNGHQQVHGASFGNLKSSLSKTNQNPINLGKAKGSGF